MELRYQLALVTGAGAGLGRELAVGLSRAGCAVLVADRDLAAAEETVALVEAARVKAWALQVDVTEHADLRMLAARARDLGGADLLVTVGAWTPGRLTQLFLDDLDTRRGRRVGVPGVVNVSPEDDAAMAGLLRFTTAMTAYADRVRVMAVVPDWTGLDQAPVVAAVVDLLAHGEAGVVIEVGGDQPPRPLTALR